MAWEDQAQERYQRSEKGRATKKRWLAENRDKVNARVARWQKANPEKVMLTAARQRAIRKDLEFSIDVSDIQIPERCPVLGMLLERGVRGDCPNAPSLDRIDNSRGYVKGNVRVISNRANALKSDATVEELEALLRYAKEAQCAS